VNGIWKRTQLTARRPLPVAHPTALAFRHGARGAWRVARGAWRGALARGAWRGTRGAWRVARGAWEDETKRWYGV